MRLSRTRRFIPGIDDTNTCLLERLDVPSDDGKAIVKCSCGDQQVRLGKRMSALAPQLVDQSPLQKHVFCESENASRETRSDKMVQPLRNGEPGAPKLAIPSRSISNTLASGMKIILRPALRNASK